MRVEIIRNPMYIDIWYYGMVGLQFDIEDKTVSGYYQLCRHEHERSNVIVRKKILGLDESALYIDPKDVKTVVANNIEEENLPEVDYIEITDGYRYSTEDEDYHKTKGNCKIKELPDNIFEVRYTDIVYKKEKERRIRLFPSNIKEVEYKEKEVVEEECPEKKLVCIWCGKEHKFAKRDIYCALRYFKEGHEFE